MWKYFILGLVILIIQSCTTNNNKPTNMNLVKNDSLDTVEIKMSRNNYKFIRGKVFNYLIENENKSFMYFDKHSGDLLSIENRDNKTGRNVNYTFEGDVLKTKVIYYLDDMGNKSSSEVFSYKNEVLDISNSAFIEVEVISINDNNVKCKISYLSGYNFIEGKIFEGEKIFNLNDTTGVKSYKFNGKSQIVTFSKKLAEKNMLSLSILITRATDKEISYRKTYPSEGQNKFSELYVKEVVW